MNVDNKEKDRGPQNQILNYRYSAEMNQSMRELSTKLFSFNGKEN